LALVTIDANELHRLRLFKVDDYQHKKKIPAVQETLLETPIRREKRLDYSGNSSAPQLVDDSGEVNAMAFSPDGLYLALARSDDLIEVYDPRDLSRGALYTFEHPREPVPSRDHYGAVKVEWVRGPGGGSSLVTAGADGLC
jgi:WD40 repeat protein